MNKSARSSDFVPSCQCKFKLRMNTRYETQAVSHTTRRAAYMAQNVSCKTHKVFYMAPHKGKCLNKGNKPQHSIRDHMIVGLTFISSAVNVHAWLTPPR